MLQGEIARLEQQSASLAEENEALRTEGERLEARDAALQGHGLENMHNDQLSQLILTLTQARCPAALKYRARVWRAMGQAIAGECKAPHDSSHDIAVPMPSMHGISSLSVRA